MLKALTLAAALLTAGPAMSQDAHPGEEPVEPYEVSDANAGASPVSDPGLFDAFHGQAGVARIVADLIRSSRADPRISDIFQAADLVRLERTLNEQFCYLLAGPCRYTGRNMDEAHRDQGLQTRDFNALVENLQAAMTREGVPFRAQNKLLAKLAPMHREMVDR